ncbi:tRNA-specific adenosine deaminase [Paraoerskovia sediminicola]|uniref:tRNA-specific adenosine deaminase n=1 Tax=Paraoerskovia sediminicola TaxID=1138587 RepID=A0ABM8G616_9CELL|nr:nucleoside deaminase [Paraoerskovia sediminicola]BDZ43603.1 tRNA-specific adenosine deaminase [Paraoerskovia sediminicola]
MDTLPVARTAEPTTHHLDRAVALAVENVARAGGPFGAVVVTADGQVFEGVNRVTSSNDPTAHAEVQAIRAACTALGTFDLSGATLWSSCEPCPMCLSSALWARVEAVHFAADRHDAAAAGFDDAVFYDFFDTAPADRAMPVRQAAAGAPVAPFDAWRSHAARVDY